VTASAGGQPQGEASGSVGQEFVLQLPHARLWSPDAPFLYDLEVALVASNGGQAVSLPLVLHSLIHGVWGCMTASWCVHLLPPVSK